MPNPIITGLCSAPDSQLDASMRTKIEAWGDPPKAIEVLEVLDLSIHASLASGAVIGLLQVLYDEACKSEGVKHEEVVKGAAWRGSPPEPQPEARPQPTVQDDVRRAVGALRYQAAMWNLANPGHTTCLSVTHIKQGETERKYTSSLEFDSFTDALLELVGPGEPLPEPIDVVNAMRETGAPKLDYMNDALQAWQGAGDVDSIRATFDRMTDSVDEVDMSYHINILAPFFGFMDLPEYDRLQEAVRARAMREGGEERVKRLGLGRTKEEAREGFAAGRALMRAIGRGG